MERYSLAVKVAAAAEPLTRTEAKAHLRVDSDITDQDGLIDGLVIAAREWTENYCRRSWVRRTLELRLDCFPGEILLPRGPVISVSSVQYQDAGGTLQTLASSSYETDLYSMPARIRPPFGALWPIPKIGTMNAVVVTYIAGYADQGVSPTDLADNVPSAVKAAIKLLLGHWYENREAVSMNAAQPAEVPFAVKQLLAPFEIRDFALE